MESETLNVPAVIAGAVAAFLAGWVIYHPRVLGKAWATGSGVDIGGSPPAVAFLAQIVGLVALAIVIGMTATINFLGTALIAIVAAASLVVSGGAFLKKSSAALAIDGGYIVLAGVLMIAAQGLL